jgi:hypothetical protein
MAATLVKPKSFTIARVGRRVVVRITEIPSNPKDSKIVEFKETYKSYVHNGQDLLVLFDVRTVVVSPVSLMLTVPAMVAFFKKIKDESERGITASAILMANNTLANLVNKCVQANPSVVPSIVTHDVTVAKDFLRNYH